MAEARLRVTWKRSAISKPRSQREVVRSLGLRRLNHTVELPDTPAVRGALHKVRHLLEVSLIEPEEPADEQRSLVSNEKSPAPASDTKSV